MEPPICKTDPNSLKLAIAIALFRLKNSRSQISLNSESDALHWKKKAKDRKMEILKLKEEIKILEDSRGSEIFPEIASCRCHFFDGFGDLNEGDDSGREWINEVLRRRFIRLVRWKRRKKVLDDGAGRRRIFSDFDEENEIERLSTSIDFLVEFIDGRSDSSFSPIFHQAVDFILASLKNLLSSRKGFELLEDIVNGLILRLAGRMCTTIECDVGDSDAQFLVQHLLRKLGTIAFVGQHAMLLISQKISATAERMLFMDPFDDSFPTLHCSIFLMIQLLEFLVSDNFQSWTKDENFDYKLLEEWLRSIVRTHKGLKLLESRNVLYALYTERLIGELVRRVGPLISDGKLDSEVLSGLLR